MRTKHRSSAVVAAIGLAVGVLGFGAVSAAAADASNSPAGSSTTSSSSESLQEILVTAIRTDVDRF